MKRISSLLSAFLLLSGLLLSCAQDTTPDDEAQNSESTVQTAEIPEDSLTGRENARDNIPADLRFDGEEVRVLLHKEQYYSKWDIEGTDNAGDLVTDAIWERNRKVEERFGLTIVPFKTQNSDFNPYRAEVKTIAMSGSDEYDLISAGGGGTVTNSLYPYLLELSDLEHLDITSPWWFTDAILGLSFDEEHFRYLLGDHQLVDYFKAGVIFYNKDIYSDIQGGADADELYQKILDGQWTYDAMSELVAISYADLNGDGKENIDDRFGLMLPKGVDEATPHMLFSCDITTYARTPEGGIDLSPMNNPKNVEVIDKLIPLIHKTTGSLVTDKNIDSPVYFTENRTLFWAGRLSNITHGLMRDMQSDYGIIPYPKFNEEQKEYVSYIHSSATFTCALKSITDDRQEMIGAFLEGWAAEAHRTVITPFIESALKLKYTRDSLSGQIVDIIFDNTYIDFTHMFSANMSHLYQNGLANNVNSGDNKFSSNMGKLLDPAQKALDTYILDILESED